MHACICMKMHVGVRGSILGVVLQDPSPFVSVDTLSDLELAE